MNIVLMSSVRTFFQFRIRRRQEFIWHTLSLNGQRAKKDKSEKIKNEWHNDMIDGDEYSMTRHMRKLMGKKRGEQ